MGNYCDYSIALLPLEPPRSSAVRRPQNVGRPAAYPRRCGARRSCRRATTLAARRLAGTDRDACGERSLRVGAKVYCRLQLKDVLTTLRVSHQSCCALTRPTMATGHAAVCFAFLVLRMVARRIVAHDASVDANRRLCRARPIVRPLALRLLLHTAHSAGCGAGHRHSLAQCGSRWSCRRLFGFDDRIAGAGYAGRKLQVKRHKSQIELLVTHIRNNVGHEHTACCCRVARIELLAGAPSIDAAANVVGTIVGSCACRVVLAATGAAAGTVSVSVDSPNRLR